MLQGIYTHGPWQISAAYAFDKGNIYGDCNTFNLKIGYHGKILKEEPLLLSLLTSCQESREAGDLLGQWRQAGLDNHYISFSGSIIWIKDLSQGPVYGNFQHTGDSLFIQCYSAKALPMDTAIVENHWDLGHSMI